MTDTKTKDAVAVLAAPTIRDLTEISEPDLTATIDIPLCPHELAALQAEADERGVALEDYVRWKLVTASEAVLSGASLARVRDPMPSS